MTMPCFMLCIIVWMSCLPTVDHKRARREIAEFRRAFEFRDGASGLASASPWLVVGVVVWLNSGLSYSFTPVVRPEWTRRRHHTGLPNKAGHRG